MNWNPLLASDVDGLSVNELTSLRTAAGKDVLPTVLTNVILTVRGACAAGENPLGPEGTIPDSLRDAALCLLRFRYLTSVPGGLITEDRRKDKEEAVALLDRVRDGKQRVERPDGTAPATPSPRLTAKTLVATRADQDGR